MSFGSIAGDDADGAWVWSVKAGRKAGEGKPNVTPSGASIGISVGEWVLMADVVVAWPDTSVSTFSATAPAAHWALSFSTQSSRYLMYSMEAWLETCYC